MASSAGLAHVAAISFLAARAVPSFAFWVALAGGASLAREAQVRGLRAGAASSTAAMLQTVAIMGPLRFNAPLTQALTAPVLGAMYARGRGRAAMGAACLSIRLVHYAVISAFGVFVIVGAEAFAGSYDALLGWLPVLPDGLAGALILMAVSNLVSAIFFSVVQVAVYRHALAGWETRAAGPAPGRPALAPAEPERAGADPRAALGAAIAVSAVLLVSHDWIVLAVVALWLAAAAPLARHGSREVARIGGWLAVMLAAGTLVTTLIGGLGATEAGERALRAALLVLVATWLRLAAGSGGLREAFRAALGRLGRVPAAREAGELLGELDSGRLLAGSARTLQDRLRGAGRRPRSLADAVLTWAAQEARSLPSHHAAPGAPLRLRARDAALALSVLLPAGAVAVALG